MLVGPLHTFSCVHDLHVYYLIIIIKVDSLINKVDVESCFFLYPYIKKVKGEERWGLQGGHVLLGELRPLIRE